MDDEKLREVFRLAGRIVRAEVNKDRDGKSRGYGIVEYTHPVEAVQAISMFKDQKVGRSDILMASAKQVAKRSLAVRG